MLIPPALGYLLLLVLVALLVVLIPPALGYLLLLVLVKPDPGGMPPMLLVAPTAAARVGPPKPPVVLPNPPVVLPKPPVVAARCLAG